MDRRLPDPGFPGDDGSAPPALAAALARFAESPRAAGDVLAALVQARVFVPVVAILAEEDDVPPGELRREKTTEMALVTLHGTDGRRALPAFTSTETLARWDRSARPVPAEAPRVAIAVGQEGADVLVLDVAGPVPFVVSSDELRRLAEGDSFARVADQPQIRAAVRGAVDRHPELDAAWLDAIESADARLTIRVAHGVEVAHAQTAARQLAAWLQTEPELRRSVRRGFEVALVLPGDEPPSAPVYRRADRAHS